MYLRIALNKVSVLKVLNSKSEVQFTSLLLFNIHDAIIFIIW
jgi:hypothetical protein